MARPKSLANMSIGALIELRDDIVDVLSERTSDLASNSRP